MMIKNWSGERSFSNVYLPAPQRVFLQGEPKKLPGGQAFFLPISAEGAKILAGKTVPSGFPPRDGCEPVYKLRKFMVPTFQSALPTSLSRGACRRRFSLKKLGTSLFERGLSRRRLFGPWTPNFCFMVSTNCQKYIYMYTLYFKLLHILDFWTPHFALWSPQNGGTTHLVYTLPSFYANV